MGDLEMGQQQTEPVQLIYSMVYKQLMVVTNIVVRLQPEDNLNVGDGTNFDKYEIIQPQ